MSENHQFNVVHSDNKASSCVDEGGHWAPAREPSQRRGQAQCSGDVQDNVERRSVSSSPGLRQVVI